MTAPLDFVRSWPAVGQGCGIVEENSFSALRNPPLLYCMPAVNFLGIHFASANSLQARVMLE